MHIKPLLSRVCVLYCMFSALCFSEAVNAGLDDVLLLALIVCSDRVACMEHFKLCVSLTALQISNCCRYAFFRYLP